MVISLLHFVVIKNIATISNNYNIIKQKIDQCQMPREKKKFI